MDGEPHPEDDGWVAAVCVAGDEHPAGCGVVLDETRVLTCAHVLPGDEREVRVSFPKAEEIVPPRRVKKVIRPAAGSPEALDLVVLLLDEPVPAGVPTAPVRCPRPRDLVGKRWWAFGFPPGNALGSFAEGKVGGTLSYGWVRLDTDSRYPVEPGFSGGGLWSPDYQAVVGVVGHGNRAQGDGHAITFYQADQCFPDQKLRTLAERYSASDAGDIALTQWGWSLADDPEGRRHWRPRARGVTSDSERGYRFRGRTSALQKIAAWLARDTAERGVLLITGDPGAGKSAVLGRIVTTADPEAARQLPPSDTAVRAEPGSVACAVHAKSRTALEIATEIAKAASAPIPERLEDFPPSLRDSLSERADPRFNVIIDALDESTEPRAVIAKVILPLAETCADVGARLVVGTRRHDADGDLLAAFGPAARTVDLNHPDYFTPADLTAYTLATLQLSGDERPANPYTNPKTATPMAERIAALSSTNFLVAGLTAFTHGRHDTVAVDPAELSFAPNVDGRLREYLEYVPDVNGIPAETLLTALAYAESPGLPVSLWRIAIRALDAGDLSEMALRKFARSKAASFLVESTGENDNAQFRLFHQALNDALLHTRGLLVRRHEDEQGLTRAFMATGQQSGWDHALAYLLRSLPGHAVRAGMVDDLLADDDYLLHAELLRVRAAADRVTTPAGSQRARLVRLSPNEAIAANAPARAAMFSVTEALEGTGDAYRHSSTPKIPYVAVWAAAPQSQEHLILHGHDGGVDAICAFTSTDGTPRLATASADTTVRIWNPETGTALRTLHGHTGAVNAVCFFIDSDGTPRLATASADATIRIWNPHTGTETRTLHGHNGAVWSMCTFTTTSGAARLATTSRDATVRIWDLDTGTQIRTLHGHNDRVWSVCVSSITGDQTYLATASDDGTVRVWDPDTGAQIRTLHGHNDWVRSVCAFSTMDGLPRLASVSDDKTVRIWDLSTGTEVDILRGHGDSVTAVCAFTMDDYALGLLASVSNDKTVRIWHPDTGTRPHILHGHNDWVQSVCAFTAVDGSARLATASDDKTVRIWNPFAYVPYRRQYRIRSLSAFTTSDGSARLATASGDKTIRIWDPDTGAQTHTLGQNDPVRSVCAYTAPDGAPRLATTSADKTVRIWNPDTGAQTHTLRGHNATLQSVCAFTTADGAARLATASDDRTVRIWNPDTGTELRTIHGHHNVARAVCAYTTSGGTPRLATASDDRTVRIWNPDTGAQIRALQILTLHGHEDSVMSMCAYTTPHGTRGLAIGSFDGTVRIWNSSSGTEAYILRGHDRCVRSMCAYIADNGTPRLATASDDRTVRIWDPELGTSLLVIPVRDEASSVAYADGLLFVGTEAGLLAVRLHLEH